MEVSRGQRGKEVEESLPGRGCSTNNVAKGLQRDLKD